MELSLFQIIGFAILLIIVGVVLIKSVSDYADPEKSDNYQDYAMYTSAQVAKHVVCNHLEY